MSICNRTRRPFNSPSGDERGWNKFNVWHIWVLRNPFTDVWKSPLLARASRVLHQTQISGITLREPSRKWSSCCVRSIIGESVHHVAICLYASSLLSHFPRNQHPADWITLTILSSFFSSCGTVNSFYPITTCCALSIQSRHSGENIRASLHTVHYFQ